MSAYAEDLSEISSGVSPSSGGKLQGVEDLHVDVVFQGSAEGLDSEAFAKGEGFGAVGVCPDDDMVVETEPPSSERMSTSHPRVSVSGRVM